MLFFFGYHPLPSCHPSLFHSPPVSREESVGHGSNCVVEAHNKYSKWVRELCCSVFIALNNYFTMYRRNRECADMTLFSPAYVRYREVKGKDKQRFCRSFKGTEPQDPTPFEESRIASRMNCDWVCCRVTPGAAVWRRHFAALCAPRGWTAPTDGALATSYDWKQCYNVGIRCVGECLLFFSLLFLPPLPAVRNCGEVAGKSKRTTQRVTLELRASHHVNTCEWHHIGGSEWQEKLLRSSPCGFPKIQHWGEYYVWTGFFKSVAFSLF